MSLTPKEQKILDSIIVRSDNDPSNPEFPADDPKFPATPTYQIEVEWFSNVWLKDESRNPTGTHKDRLAWEIVVTYTYFLKAKQWWWVTWDLPHMSIISSWSAATAIQTQLKKYNLPCLKVLVDYNIDPKYTKKLENLWAEIYLTDLSKKLLTPIEILQLTNNENGVDITSWEALDPTQRYYDRLSYEILNSSPEYCFLPFGSWNLYENLLNVNKKEISSVWKNDPRFQWDMMVLKRCHFLWATTNNPNTLAEKLYSPHLPFVHFSDQWIKIYKQSWFCGNKSQVHIVQEQWIKKAMEVAVSQDISCEPSGIAGLALLLQMREQIPSDAMILIVNTGKTRL